MCVPVLSSLEYVKRMAWLPITSKRSTARASEIMAEPKFPKPPVAQPVQKSQHLALKANLYP